MKNATIEDVERVQDGEFVPNVMFTTYSGVLVHMKDCLVEEMFNLREGQKIFETDSGKLYICHPNNLLPIKKHSFSSNAPKKIKRKPVEGSRKYVKVAYNLEKAIDVCKNQGYITLVYGRTKLKRFADVIDGVWRHEDGSWGCPFHTSCNAYEYMYVPVEISPKHQATISTSLSKSINQFVEDAKLGEVMRKAGWKINDGEMPYDGDDRTSVMFRNGGISRVSIKDKYRYWGLGSIGSIVAYRVKE